jgi:hypothetical protein
MNSKINPTRSLSVLSALLFACFMQASLQGQTFLRVDFGTYDFYVNPIINSPAQPGFTEICIRNIGLPGVTTVIPETDSQWTNGSVEITIASGKSLDGTGTVLSRDRSNTTEDNGSFTYNALYRDIAIAQGTDYMSIGISGLKAETFYDIRVFAYDANNAGKQTFTNTTGTGDVSGSITWTAGYVFDGDNPDENRIFSTVLKIQSDGNGRITLLNQRTTSLSNEALLNGLEITAVTAIPEPSVSCLLAASGAMLVVLACLYRRRCK